MKKILVILLMMISVNGFAANHYLKVGGGGAGTYESPFATIAQVNAHSFSGGDTLFVYRGDTWRETFTLPSSGTSGNYIVVTCYGDEGLPLPKIFGSNTTAWTDMGGHVWKSNSTFTDPYGGSYDGGVFFRDGSDNTTWGFSNILSGHIDTATLAVEYDWTWISNYIYIYSPTDPNTRYASVEVAQRDNVISFNDKNYWKFFNLDLRYSKLAAFKEKWPFRGVTFGIEIGYCHISHIGIKGSSVGYGIEIWHSDTWAHHNTVHDCGRRGINARTQDADYTVNTLGYTPPIRLENVLFEYNTVYDCYHSMMSFVSENRYGRFYNGVMRYNNCYESAGQHLTAPEGYYCGHYGFSGRYGFNGEDDSVFNTFANMKIYGNISVNATGYSFDGSGVDHFEYYNNIAYGLHPNRLHQTVGCFWTQGGSHDYTIKNNIFYNNYPASEYDLTPCITINWGCYSNLVLDNNVYYTTTPTQTAFTASLPPYGNGGAFMLSEYADYQAATHQDYNSVFADPKVVSSSDLHLQASSPAIGAGDNVGLERDYEGNLWADPPSAGVYEYAAGDATATDIVSFILTQQTGAATINTTNHTVSIEVSHGTSVTALTPTITLSPGATVSPTSGTATDFTNPVTYTVTAEDTETTQEWVITVTIEESASTPTVVASDVVITAFNVTVNSEVTSDGGASVSARGICWGTSSSPTVSGNHSSNGTGTGSFESVLTGLQSNVIYYIRAYATNASGTSYSTEIQFMIPAYFFNTGSKICVDNNGKILVL